MKRVPFFQLASDIHLEFPNIDKQYPKIPGLAPILVLAGDIGSLPTENSTHKLVQFLNVCADTFEVVLYIAGNHEFYGKTYGYVKQTLSDICSKRENLYFLDDSSYYSKKFNCRFLGSTLWTKIPSERHKAVYAMLNDYKKVDVIDAETKKVRKLKIEDTDKYFEDGISFFEKEIKNAKENKESVVLISHHAPLRKGTSDPKYAEDKHGIQSAFASDLTDLLADPIIAFCFGHTHWSTVIDHESGVKIFANQVGYLNWGGGIKDSHYHLGWCAYYEKSDSGKISLTVNFDEKLDEQVKSKEKEIIVLDSIEPVKKDKKCSTM